jgi:hypothetical protein
MNALPTPPSSSHEKAVREDATIATKLARVLTLGTRCAIVLGAFALVLALVQGWRSPAPDLSRFFASNQRGVASPFLDVFAACKALRMPSAWALAQCAVIVLVCVPVARVAAYAIVLLQSRSRARTLLFACAIVVLIMLIVGLAGAMPLHA